jgi:hypothetical protein
MHAPRLERVRALTGRAAAVAVALTLLSGGCRLEYAPPDERQASAGTDADTTLVLAELRAYYQDFSARNWALFESHFWEGATITTVWQPPGTDAPRVWTTTVPAFVAAAPEGPGSREIFEETMLNARIRLTGGLAQAWVRYRARFGDSGAVQEWEGVDAFTLMRHEGRWRIVSLAFRSDGGGP